MKRKHLILKLNGIATVQTLQKPTDLNKITDLLKIKILEAIATFISAFTKLAFNL
jgi:hypothetical protein